MDRLLWESLKTINENTQSQITLIIEQLHNLLGIIEDHECDMLKMVNKINELEKEISELKGSR